jgi:hypothetical protein
MTKEENVYADTLNLFGSDPEPQVVQDLLDAEHGAADPEYAQMHMVISVRMTTE